MKGLVNSLEDGRAKLTEAIHSGRALQHFAAMLRCQGVTAAVAHELCYGDPWRVLPHVPHDCRTQLLAPRDGKI
jgi:hypothetical protein